MKIKHKHNGSILLEIAAKNLRDANLCAADLCAADLCAANLRDADLCGANLRDANLCGADLRGADLRDADLCDANLRDADLPFAPKIENLDAKILEKLNDGGKLKMDSWHTCETTHCRAGWAITIAGDAGKVLESVFGPSVAGALIYNASTGKVPNFMATEDEAMADMKKAARA